MPAPHAIYASARKLLPGHYAVVRSAGSIQVQPYWDVAAVTHKVDRASMGVSLEARSPLLDHRLVEWAWRIPVHLKRRKGQSKWLLRQVLYKYVPPALVERPKMGFGIPLGAWLRGSLRDWAEALLDEKRLREGGLLRPDPIRRVWLEHLEGRRKEDHALWAILMFQAWLNYKGV